jgi:hypothetical protein
MLRFEFIHPYEPTQVKIAWTQSSREIRPEVEAAIASTWQKESARPGIHLFDGPMCRLENVEARDDSLSLLLSPVSYKIFVGTNLHNPHLAKTFGRNVLANPVGLSALLCSADDYLLLGRRSGAVAYYPNRIHPFAGCLEPGEKIDLFSEIRRELREELSFSDADVKSLQLIGLSEDISIYQPEFLFAVRSTRTRGQIESHLDPGEHRGILAIPATRDAVDQELKSIKTFTPVAVAALLAWGKMQFGAEWFDAKMSEIC